MSKYVIATTKSWNIENALKLIEHNKNIVLIDEKNSLTKEYLDSIQPEYVFFPHWSWIIPKEIYENFRCVVFHMTDLPFGRGGSPLQNLLVRGIYETKVSAIKVVEGLDEGPVYLKESIDISEGNADEILKAVSNIVFSKMIPIFLENELIPKEQVGEAICFKRRKPEQSEIPEGLSQRQLYDYIRMLDGEGYPTAFVKCIDKRIYFTNAQYNNGVVTATANFSEDKKI